MVNNCGACTRAIRSTQASITCVKCESSFHPICINISDTRKISEEAKTNWLCPMCQSRAPRRDNSNTPIRGALPSATNDESDAAKTREKTLKTPLLTPTVLSPNVACSPAPAPQSEIAQILSEIKLLRDDIGDMKSHITSLAEHIKACVTRIDEHEGKIEDALCRIGLMEQRESKIIQLESTIADLRYHLNAREQAYLKNEVEVVGVTETPEESTMHLACVIANKIGITLNQNEIDYVARVGPRKRESPGDNSDAKKAPRPLVIRFVRRGGREDFLKSARSRRKLTTEDIEVTGPKRNVYINERLTAENRRLFRMARQHSRAEGYKYCWIKNATTYIRKQEGNPAIPIRNLGELQSRFEVPLS